jgi:hypothetical protein
MSISSWLKITAFIRFFSNLRDGVSIPAGKGSVDSLIIKAT